MAILKVDTITSADTPTVSITDGASISGVTTFSNEVNIPTWLVHSGDTNTKFGFEGPDTITFETAGSERLRIASDGKVSIGNLASADSLLHIHDGSAGSIAASSAAKLTIESSASDYNVLQFLSPSSAAQQIRFGDASDNGVGWIQYNHANNSLAFGANGPARLRIDSSGQVGVGTATPGSLLHLGADSATAQLRIQRTNEAANTNDYGRIYWASYGGTLTGQLSVARESAENNGYMWFGTASSGTLTEKVRITSAGQLQIAPAGSAKMSFYHDSGGSLNHITSNNGNEIKVSSGNGNSNGIEFWDYTGVNKRCQIDAEGIKFNTDTAAANGLDDYEEGNITWYLRKSDNTSGGSDNGSVVKYTKVGRMVVITGRIRTDSVSSSSSHVYHLDGTLPFTPATAGTAVVGHWRSQDIIDGTLTASIAWQESSTTIYLYSPDSVSDYSAASNNVGTNNQTNLVCTFTLCYQST